MFFRNKKKIVHTEFGKAIYVSSNTINEDMLFLKKNNIKGIIISNDNDYLIDNVNFLKENDFIESITIYAYNKIDYSAIHYLKKLKTLNINTLYRDNQEINFSSFQNLKICSFNWRKKIISLFDCHSLETLSIGGFRGESLQQFANLYNLKILRIYKSSIKGIGELNKLSKLDTLDLFGNRKLMNFNNIYNLISLKHLCIESCKNYTNLDGIEKLKNLESLEVNNCKEIDSLKPLRELQKLKKVDFQDSTNIIDGDISPCIKLISSFQDRKHYNYSYLEIKRLRSN